MTEDNSTQETEGTDDATSEDALSSLAAALEAKDETDEKETTDEMASEEGKEEEGSSKEDSETSEEKEGSEEEKDAKDDDKTGEEEGPPEVDEIAELRSLLRSQKREMSLLKAKQGRVDKRTSKVIDEETGEETDIKEELSPLEAKTEARNELGAQRGAQLEIMLEQMSDTKKWGDVKEVVTESRVEEIIDTISAHITKEQGGDADENRLDVELSVWGIANPYKYMYDLIKQYHPDYMEKEEKKETETDSTEKKEGKKKEPVKTNASIGGMKGGSDKGGWTAAKIDAIDELDLGKVPKDVYDKYLRGELD